MIAADRSRRVIVAATILLAHAAAIYGLQLLHPRFTSAIASAPVELRFIEESSSTERWQPPEVRTVSVNIRAPMPDTPLMESTVSAPSEHAISAPTERLAAVSPATTNSNVPKLVASVEYLREPAPRYPPQSRKLREQGLVVLRVLIDERGMACSIEVETSSGHERLYVAAREAVAHAAFRPYIEEGSPRRALVLIPIEFSLNRSSV